MVNLTKYFETTKHALDGGEVILKQRPYLGMSQLGHECSRYLWYSFRWFYIDKTSPRMIRLWNRGHREEAELIKALESIGMKCVSDQLEFSTMFGHILGHRDGIGTGVIEAPKTPHLLEFKTIKDKDFKELQKKKLKAYSLTYYGQCQLYMHFSKLKRCLFIAVNKNDDDLYIERIHYDKAHAEMLIRKGESIVMAELPPARAFSTPTYFKCTWCSAKEQCWKDAPPVKTCRSCTFSEPNNKGSWNCTWTINPVEIPLEIQRTGCQEYSQMLLTPPVENESSN